MRRPKNATDLREMLAYSLHRAVERISSSASYEVVLFTSPDGTKSVLVVRSRWDLGVETTLNVRLPGHEIESDAHGDWPVLHTGVPTIFDVEQLITDHMNDSDSADAEEHKLWRP